MFQICSPGYFMMVMVQYIGFILYIYNFFQKGM